jgi:iron(III) transport system substrate-binding protein
MKRDLSGWLVYLVCTVSLLVIPRAHANEEPLSINWYHEAEYLQPVIAAFTKETGIPVKVTSDYDTFDTDVIMVSDYKGLTEAGNFGKFRRLDPDFFAKMAQAVPAQWRDADGRWLGVVLRVRTAVVNRKLVQESDWPRQLMDLADPKWQGRMTIRSAANVYNRSLMAYMIYRHGEAQAARWARGIVKNFGASQGYRGDTANARLVAQGEYAISFLNTYYLGYLQSREDEPQALRNALENDLQVVWLDDGPHGLFANVTGVGISSSLEDRSPKLGQAQQLIAFLLSKRGQSLLSEHVFKYPVRRDVEPSAYLRKFGSFKIDELDLNALRYLYDDADRLMREADWNLD